MTADGPLLWVTVYTGHDEVVDSRPLQGPWDCPSWSWLADTVAEAHRLSPPPPPPYVAVHSEDVTHWQFESDNPRHLPPIGGVRRAIRLFYGT